MRAKLFILSFIFLWQGCVMVPEYNISIRNNSNSTISDAYVLYDNFRSIGGILVSGANKLYIQPDRPIPDKAIVQWRTEDGILHKKEVEVKKILPTRFSGEIRFIIDSENNVTVDFESNSK